MSGWHKPKTARVWHFFSGTTDTGGWLEAACANRREGWEIPPGSQLVPWDQAGPGCGKCFAAYSKHCTETEAPNA